MIPRRLEQLIHEGRAAFRTWCVGGAAVSRVPVTKGTFIVIVGMDYSPFIDSSLFNSFSKWQNSRDKMQHQVILATSKNKYQFNFRDWYTLAQDQVSGVPNFCMPPGKPHSVECYCIFDEDVRVNIRPVGALPEAWASTFGTMPDTSDELTAPLYAGTTANPGFNTLLEFQFQANDTTVVPANDQVPVTISPADFNPQFQAKVGELANPAIIPGGEQNGMNYPLVNFQYVEVFEVLPSQMKKGG